MKCSIATIGLAVILMLGFSNSAESSISESKVAELARSIDLLVHPEKGETIIQGPGKKVTKGRTKPLDSKKIAVPVAELLKTQTDLILEALKTRNLSEIVFAKFISDQKKASFKELLEQKKEVYSVESLRAASVPLAAVKEALDQIYAEIAFISLDEMK